MYGPEILQCVVVMFIHKSMKKVVLTKYMCAFVLLFSMTASAQDQHQTETLKRLARDYSMRFMEEKAIAIRFADSVGIPWRQENEDGSITELMRLKNGMPMYYITHNANGASVINTSNVYPGGSDGLNLTGTGQTLGIWDGGKVRDTHQELAGRVVQKDGATSLSDHATHVAGTMIASGITASAKGMSYQAGLDAYDWNDDHAEMAGAAADGLNVSQHSYGYITGWHYGSWSGNTAWHWYGNESINATEDSNFGFYDYYAAAWDNIAYHAPNYLIVKSAGNDRGQGPSPGTGHYVWNGSWNYSTTTRQKDGGNNGYDCISRNGNAKNILTIGAVEANGTMASFSSWGPTDDGRVKPDVVAKGVSVYSSGSGSDTHYSYKSGTSMSGPMVSGSTGLLLHHQENLHPGEALLSSTLKALIIHTADDGISGSPGPDYRFGWGMMDTEKAAAVMSVNALSNGMHIMEFTLENGEEMILPVKAIGNEPLRATMVWTDLPGTSPPSSLNPPDLMLVNDLDMIIADANNNEYFPYILDPGNPSASAITGDNFRDNVEMVHLANAAENELYMIKISHKGSLSGGSQAVSLIISGNQDAGIQYLLSAEDHADNYSVWNENDNGGYGFEPWGFDAGGAGGSYLGETGLGIASFGIYSGENGETNFFIAGRDFVSPMPVSSTFSISLGYNVIAGNAEVGLSFSSGGEFRLALKFVGGSSEWLLNDGGSDIATGIPWAGNTALDFALIRGQDNVYSVQITQGSNGFNAVDYSATSGMMAIDRVEIFSSGQGAGNHLGFDHLKIDPDFSIVQPLATMIARGHLTLTENLEVENLLIEKGSLLYLNPGVNLTVNASLFNMNTQAGFILGSDTNGTASLLHHSYGVQARAERFIGGESYAWHMISSPVDSQNIVQHKSFDEGAVFAWHEPAQTWVSFQNNTVWPTWDVANNGHVNFVPGRGYLVAYDSGSNNTGQKKVFEGLLNQGDFEFELSRKAHIEDPFEGFNLIGNPYPSAVDWKSENGWGGRENLQGDEGAYTFWVWNHEALQYGAYNSLAMSDSGTHGVTRYIPAMQAFWIKAQNDNTGLTMNNNVRRHAEQQWMKNREGDKKTIHLSLRDTDSGYSDEAILEFGHLFDGGGALKLFSMNDHVPSLYLLKNDRKRSISFYTDIATNPSVSLGLKAGKTGMHTLTVKNTGVSDHLLLEDRLAGIVHDLTRRNEYHFHASQGTDEARFILHFKALAVGKELLQKPSVAYHQGVLTIVNHWDGNAVVRVFDGNGRQIRVFEAGKGLNQYGFEQAPGIYLIQLIALQGSYSVKILTY
jgi:hypothetical protein